MTALIQGALALEVSPASTFQFKDRPVRIVMRNGEPWFVCSDVAEALAYRDAEVAARHLGAHQKADTPIRCTSTNGTEQTRNVTIISESGLYRLVLRSRKPEAVAFSDWVTGEVLPAIRKTGSYSNPEPQQALPLTIDPAALLLSGQKTPTVACPPEVERAIAQKAWELTGEANALIQEHLRRCVAYSAEVDSPTREVNTPLALRALDGYTLGRALAHTYIEQVENIVSHAQTVAYMATEMAKRMKAAIHQGGVK